MSDLKFFEALRNGDLVLGSVHNSEKQHIVKLVQCKSEWQGREPGESDAEHRARWVQLWSARAYCGIGSKWCFRPSKSLWAEEDWCARCWAKWRALDMPTVLGMPKPGGEVFATLPWMPFAWQEVPVSRHPLDLGPRKPKHSTSVDVEAVNEESNEPEASVDEVSIGADSHSGRVSMREYGEGEKEGEYRSEVRRWVRGAKYVRVVQHHEGNYPYGVYYGWIGVPKTDQHNVSSSIDVCLVEALKVMAAGGTPPRDY